ncbi:MAG: hypothetical protein ACRCSF_13070 [Mycobacteriaceae bacterium]
MASENEHSSALVPFSIVRRGGYDRDEVAEFFQRLDAEIRVISADRDAAATHAQELAERLDEARDEIDELRQDIDKLSVPPTTAEGMSDRISRMLRLASDEASEMRAHAEAEAAELISVAEQDAAELRNQAQQELDNIVQRRAAMEAEHKNTMAAAHEEAARILATAKAERDQLDTEAHGQRVAVQEDFDIAMAERRSQAIALIEEQESTSKAEAAQRISEATSAAQRRIQAATEQSAQRISEAKDLTEELRTVRARILEQLMAVRGQLDETPSLLAVAQRERELLDSGIDPFTGQLDQPLADTEEFDETFTATDNTVNESQVQE